MTMFNHMAEFLVFLTDIVFFEDVSLNGMDDKEHFSVVFTAPTHVDVPNSPHETYGYNV